ncbi:Chitin biosynthesis protein CHS5 [Pseudolycoriella hygida]|uniref:Chitin biosynthesis protein CHS5 n=1 Tax=Pseudolycoriella hygida TaxID=35572 RepID=A0A9Q0S2Y5_9DIPT|nr:Chitin biosynthesis protein CHS5 [Pseudolycoriella hygida]
MNFYLDCHRNLEIPEIKACALFRKYSVLCGALNPSSLRGTNLRKHFATMCGKMGLTDNDVTNIAKFTGHSEKVHRDFYRRTTPGHEVVQMSNLLEAARGKVNRSNVKVDDNFRRCKPRKMKCNTNRKVQLKAEKIFERVSQKIIKMTHILLPFCVEQDNDVFFDILKTTIARSKVTQKAMDMRLGMGAGKLSVKPKDLSLNWKSLKSDAQQIRQSKLLGFWMVANYPTMAGKLYWGLPDAPKRSDVVTVGTEELDGGSVDDIILKKLKLRIIELNVSPTTLDKVKHFVKVPNFIGMYNERQISPKVKAFDIEPEFVDECWSALKLGGFTQTEMNLLFKQSKPFINEHASSKAVRFHWFSTLRTNISQEMVKQWKDSPPGVEQLTLESMFNDGEVEEHESAAQVQSRVPMFQMFSERVFVARFNKLRAKHGFAAKPTGRIAMDVIPELGGSRPASSDSSAESRKRALPSVEANDIQFNNAPYVVWVYTDHTRHCDMVCVAVPIISGARDVDFHLSQDNITLNVTYVWPYALLSPAELFRKKLTPGVGGWTMSHPKIHAFLTRLDEMQLSIKSQPPASIVIKLPMKVQRETNTYSFGGVKTSDGSVVMLEFQAFQKVHLRDVSSLFNELDPSSFLEIAMTEGEDSINIGNDELENVAFISPNNNSSMNKRPRTEDNSGGPIESSGGHIKSAGGPVECTCGPIECTGGPVECTGEPIECTGGPVECTGGPIECTGGPI